MNFSTAENRKRGAEILNAAAARMKERRPRTEKEAKIMRGYAFEMLRRVPATGEAVSRFSEVAEDLAPRTRFRGAAHL